MCGIWLYLAKTKENEQKLYNAFLRIKNRGPDRSRFLMLNEFIDLFLGFHRLAIMDTSVKGDQPFIIERSDKTIYVLCNGEIYNHRQIASDYDLSLSSNSDCEVIAHLRNIGKSPKDIYDLIKRSEFACIIVNVYHNKKTIKIEYMRDPTGIRPMFIGEDENGICLSSELKAMYDIVDPRSIQQVEPYSSNELIIKIKDGKLVTYNKSLSHLVAVPPNTMIGDLEMIKSRIRELFEECVISRLESDRQLGALLSGGLDSSLVVSIASKYLQENYGKQLHTFSIGIDGSGTDKQYAEMVSLYCNTQHTHIDFTQEEFINAIPETIYSIESFDTTTVRASTGQYLISKWISENTDIKVLLIGDGSDELCSGYMYFHKAPDAKASHYENIRLIEEIHLYDVLRADRGIAENGLEARVPFLDISFVDFYLSIPVEYRVPIDGMEKHLLRSSFEGYLPEQVLWRKKEAFSDGVSSKKKSWYQIIQERVDDLISNKDYNIQSKYYNHMIPPSKEALYYRKIFEGFYGIGLNNILPQYWLPKWCGNITEPSARVLDVYE